MSLESVACNRCGSLLEVPPGARFVTCRSCNTALQVQRSATSTWTEPTTEERLDRIEENVDQLAVRNELDRLDRQWEREREEYMFTTRHGVRAYPNKAGSVLMGVMVAGFGALWSVFTYTMMSSSREAFHDAPPGFGPPAILEYVFPLFGVLFIVFGVGMAIYSYRRAEKYEAAKARHEQRRAEVEKKLAR